MQEIEILASDIYKQVKIVVKTNTVVIASFRWKDIVNKMIS